MDGRSIDDLKIVPQPTTFRWAANHRLVNTFGFTCRQPWPRTLRRLKADIMPDILEDARAGLLQAAQSAALLDAVSLRRLLFVFKLAGVARIRPLLVERSRAVCK